MSYKNKTTGEIISDDEFQTRFSGQTPSNIPQVQETSPSGGGFLQRLKLSFGGSKAREQIKQIEEEQGTRGRFEVGDLADVAGAALPLAGGIAGSALGPIGSAAGAAAGQGVRRIFGGLIGADQPTAGDIAKDVAFTGAGTFVGGKILGGLFKAATKTIPEKLISTIFKQSADDIALGVKTQGKNLTQSQEILEEGFRGGPEKMMVTAWNTMKQLEAQTQAIVSGKSVNVINKQGYINLISDYLKTLKKVSFGFEPQIVQEGKTIVTGLQKAKGNTIPAEIALMARRFIDSVRRTSSFKLNPNLGPKEAAYKKSADVLRGILSKQINGLSPIMKKYSIHINAFDDLAKYAARTQNRDLFDLLDVFIMYGIDPSAYLARRGLTSAALKTNVAQGLYQGGKIFGRVPTGAVPTSITRGIQGSMPPIFNRNAEEDYQ